MDTTTNQAQDAADSMDTVKVLRALSHEIPTNDFGLPTGIYRTDMLPFHAYVPPVAQSRHNGLPTPISTVYDKEGEVPQEPTHEGEHESGQEQEASPATKVHYTAGFPTKLLERAFVTLHYDEGFPSFNDGTPFWGRMEFEPHEAFMAFERYLQMSFGAHKEYSFDASEGVGGAAFEFDADGNPIEVQHPTDGGEGEGEEEDEDDETSPASGTRSIVTLAYTFAAHRPDKELQVLQERFQEYYHLYYWNLRAQAYDMFRVVQHRKQQEIRAIETQDSHFITSHKLMDRLMVYMGNKEAFWDMMTPKVGLDMLKHLTQVQRVSVGLPAMGPPSAAQSAAAAGGGDGGGPGQSIQVAFRSIAQRHNDAVIRRGGRGGSGDGDEHEDTLAIALRDPSTTEVLQELIIKSSR